MKILTLAVKPEECGVGVGEQVATAQKARVGPCKTSLERRQTMHGGKPTCEVWQGKMNLQGRHKWRAARRKQQGILSPHESMDVNVLIRRMDCKGQKPLQGEVRFKVKKYIYIQKIPPQIDLGNREFIEEIIFKVFNS